MSNFKNNLTYFTYFKKTLDKFTEIDPREINFQNRIIIPLLEDILSDRESISVVDVSNQYKSSTNHTRDSYAGIHTPDLLIAENWNYKNNNNSSINYICICFKYVRIYECYFGFGIFKTSNSFFAYWFYRYFWYYALNFK